jgi:hypothetical protein
VDDPAPGNYVLTIKGFNIPSGTQPYWLAYQFDTANRFKWYYPSASDNLFGEQENILRWENTYNTTVGQLQYSLDNGSNWLTVNNAVDLTKGYYKWNSPDTFSAALLRMNFNAQNFNSDTFTISKRFNVNVGFNCADSFLLFWNKIPGVNLYRVYQLGDKYMEPFTITDTSIILSKQNHPSLYYAVAPILQNRTGVRSYAYNYTTQGVGCYVRTFTAQLINTSGQLNLELGTIYNVSQIFFQRLTANGYVTLSSTNVPAIQYSFTDNSLLHGLNTYRAVIQLSNGQLIYSDPEIIYYSSDPFILYPNPVPQQQDARLVNNDGEKRTVMIYNSIGMKVYETTLNNWMNTIPSSRFSKGLYLLRIYKEQQLEATLKMLVQ